MPNEPSWAERTNRGRQKPQFLGCHGMDLEKLEMYATEVCFWSRGVNWWIGDIARFASMRYPDIWFQAFPEWISPGYVERCKKVAEAYPREEDRNILASWHQHMQVANKSNRIELVAQMVENGETSDETRKRRTEENQEEQRESEKPKRKPLLMAFDVNYFIHRHWHSGAEVESADSVTKWIKRLTDRLRSSGLLTDVACCFDGPDNHRKELTKEWEEQYKPRPKKDPQLIEQIRLAWTLLEKEGFCCVSIDGMEADDCMASYAAQFDGNVSLVTQDKDIRQCLSGSCNMLYDVTWEEDSDSGQHRPKYQFISAKDHMENTGIHPEAWIQYQAIMGDKVDGIVGAAGIGEKGASDLIKEHGTAQAAIEAAQDEEQRFETALAEIKEAENDRKKPRKETTLCSIAEKQIESKMRRKMRQSLIEFEERLDITLMLVTLRTDLKVPNTTRLV